MSELAPGSLEGDVVGGVAWKAASAVVLQVSRLATALILARLLSPQDFGVAGMVLVASSLVFIFADLAFGAALVQRPELTEHDRSTVFWTNAVGGILFTLIGIALSGPIASFFGDPEVKPLFAAFSVTFFVTALSATHGALLSREMNFRTLELRRMLSFAAGAVVGIVVAVEGGGAWAIVLQQITIAVASTVLLTVLAPWRPSLTFSLASLRSMAGFSVRVFAARLLFYVNRNIDNVLVGRFIGAQALGIYSIAYNVMLTPFSQIANPIQEVVFPAFSRIQDDHQRIARGWIRVNRVVAAISVPSLLGLIVVAPDFVPAVLGERWDAAVPVIQVLSWVGLLQSLQGLNSSILEATNRARMLLRYSIVVTAASVVAFAIGLHWGVLGVAVGYAVSSTFVEPYYTAMTARAIDMPFSNFLRSLRGVFEAAATMALAVLAVRLGLEHAGVPAIVRLAVCVAVGAVVYLPLCVWRAPAVLSELLAIKRRLRPGSSLKLVVAPNVRTAEPS